jgi:hypothetical protein
MATTDSTPNGAGGRSDSRFDRPAAAVMSEVC